MYLLFNNPFFSEAFIPHGHCYLWKPTLVWLHLLSDSTIAVAYYSIPLTLSYFVRQRRDLPFNWIFLLFAAFIVACGTTHLMEVWTLWHPTYWLSGTIKAFTAIVSLFTAIQLIPLVPQALALPSPAQLEQANHELKLYQNQLEELVAARTTELVAANQQLQQEIHDRQQAEIEREQLLLRERAVREAAEAANRTKDEFLAVLSHELRSPLNPILGWAQLLRTRKFDEAATARALETIERNAKLQTQLIEDLLDVSRILQGKMVLNVEPVNVEMAIQSAIETVQLAADAKNIQIFTELDDTLKPIMGDSNRLQQIMWNLLSNAIKFTPHGGRVEVRLSIRSDEENLPEAQAIAAATRTYAQIQVSDTGKGIAPKFLPYVFDYFCQADGSTTRQFGGLGLGLAIVRHLVELHGGSVSVVSPGEGMGATFTVKLPVVTTLLQTALDREPSLETTDLSQVRVLVIDDEADMRDLITTILKEYGAKTEVASSATEALALIPQAQPDIILSDIGMPGEDGYSLIQQLRAMSPQQGGQTPAIALTAYAGEINRQKALLAGFQLHLAKPIEPTELIKAIVDLIYPHHPV